MEAVKQTVTAGVKNMLKNDGWASLNGEKTEPKCCAGSVNELLKELKEAVVKVGVGVE